MSLNDSLKKAVEADKREAVRDATEQLQSQLAAANKEIKKLKERLEICENEDACCNCHVALEATNAKLQEEIERLRAALEKTKKGDIGSCGW